DRVRWIRGATSDYGEVICALQGAEAVIHLAAYSIPYKEVPNHVLFANNVVGTYNILEAAAFLGVRRVAIASSGGILGWAYSTRKVLPKYLPIDEDHPLTPHDPYGLGKLCEEAAANSFTLKCDMETVALRPGWVLFPDQTAFLSKSGGRPITKIDVYTYIDARDLALAFRRAVEIPHKGHEALFIVADDSCANEPLSEGLPRVAPELKDMARVIEGDRSGINNSRAKKVLGWDPKHTWRRPDW
ncbi:MAG TPA: NAD(P)-dependent oxidoreductase, partial [Chloroflexota bacterium]|nr:NAD(P)-dependent oxidoreductase [Chloroflexota bacterium]